MKTLLGVGKRGYVLVRGKSFCKTCHMRMTFSFWACTEGHVAGAGWAKGEEEETRLEGQRCPGHQRFEGYRKSSGFTSSYEHTLKHYEQECDMTCSFIYFENIRWKWIDERMELEGSNPKKK